MLPHGAPIAGSNAEFRRLITSHRSGDAPAGPIGVVGGDLWRVVGAPAGGADRLRSEHARTAPIDLIEVTADSQTHWACVGAVARNSWWRGPIVAAMSAESLGAWRLAPAAHPNDGRLHVLSTGLGQPALTVTQRALARQRLRSGAHVPHPAIAVRRVEHWEHRFDRPLGLWLDGARVGRYSKLSLTIRPDAATIVF
jgi:diacylglycerol kinase family enzyme